MRTLRDFIKRTLNEGKIQDLQKKYPEVDVEYVATRDPSPTKKYLEWMLKQIEKDHSEEDLVPTVQYFHRNIQKFPQKDINQYADLKDLENEVKRLESINVSRQRSGSEEKLYEDDRYLLMRPDDKNAVMKYGAGTKWCITMRDANYYEQYTDNNVLFYFLINKTLDPKIDPMAKIAYAIHRTKDGNVRSIEYFDATDRDIGQVDTKFDVEIMKFQRIIEGDVIKQPNCFMVRLQQGDAQPEEIQDFLKKREVNVAGKVYMMRSSDDAQDIINEGIPQRTLDDYMNESEISLPGPRHRFGRLEGLGSNSYFSSLYDISTFFETILAEDPMASDDQGNIRFKSANAFDYMFVILEVNVTDQTFFKNLRSSDIEGTIFTLDGFDSDDIRIVKPREWINVLKTEVYPKFGWPQAEIDKIKVP